MKLHPAMALLLAIASIPLQAQELDLEGIRRPKTYVVYSPEPQTVAAGRKSTLQLNFRVLDGFHVNSHTPMSELLIPTSLTLEAANGVRITAYEYPPGVAYRFSFEPNEKLDVYQGTFSVKLPVVATAGQHRILGSLRYQACDHAACYPPKTLPVEVSFTAK